MTAPESTTDVALRYLGQQFAEFRTSMHDEIAALRTDLAGLGVEMRSHMAAVGPRIAVLEHRVDEAERDLKQAAIDRSAEVAAVKQQHEQDMAEIRAAKKDSKAERVAIALALLTAALAWVPSLFELIN